MTRLKINELTSNNSAKLLTVNNQELSNVKGGIDLKKPANEITKIVGGTIGDAIKAGLNDLLGLS